MRDTLKASPAMKTAALSKTVVKRPATRLWRSTRVGEVYWCEFNSQLNYLPEFDDKHLVVVLKGGKREDDVHVVIPLTSKDQSQNPHAYKLQQNPNPKSASDSWAVCDHIYTVSFRRLDPLRDGKGKPLTPEKINAADLAAISRKVMRVLAPFLALGSGLDPQTAVRTMSPTGDQGPPGSSATAPVAQATDAAEGKS